MEEAGNSARRDVKARGSRYARIVASFLARSGVRPNTISFMSVFFAACSGACLLMSSRTDENTTIALFIGAAAFIQLRLICNLFDGMVAIEGGLKTKSGEIFNDFPDRISDPLIIISAGYAVPHMPYNVELGWLAGLLAVMTAYVRVLGASAGAKQYFSGPMAKQHRMALMTFALLAAAATVKFQYHEKITYAAVAIVAIGSLLTFFRRIHQSVKELESK